MSTAQPVSHVADAEGRLPLPWLAAPLADALARQRGHALMLHAAPGIGALAFGLTLAQAWLCEAAAGARQPCGHCGSCRLVQSQLHPDLFVLLPEVQRRALGWMLADDKPEDDKKPSRQIRIGEVRAAIDWVTRTSSRGRGKVLFMHPAEAINLQAGNALLKTLEEPPAGTRVLISVSDPAHLLPTVRSRCQGLALPPPSPAEAASWLQAQGVQGADVLLAACGDRPLDALELAQAGVDAAAWAALPRALLRGQGAALSGWPVPRALDALHKLCHDAMAQASGGAGRYFPRGSVPQARLPALLEWQQALLRVARHDEHPWNEGLLLESLVAQARSAFTLQP